VRFARAHPGLDSMIGALPSKENADTLLEAVLAAARIGD